MADKPHLALPLKLTPGGSLAVVEQDSLDDVTQCVQVILSTPKGSRIEEPDFGVPDLTFSTQLATSELMAELTRWEPRADVDIDALTAQGPRGLSATVLANVSLAEV